MTVREERRLLVAFLVLAFALLALALGTVRPASAAASLDGQILAGIRDARGDAIARHPTLDAIAQRRSAEIVTDWSHDGAGAPWPWGENLAWTAAPDPAGWTIAGWLASPGHRAVLLGDWTHVGIGSTLAGDRWYIAAVFARIPGPVPSVPSVPTITLPPTDTKEAAR